MKANGLLGAAVLLCSVSQLMGVPGLTATIQPPNVVLAWPSTPSQVFVINGSPSGLPGSWTNISPFYHAGPGSTTSFVIPNVAPSLGGASGGGSSGSPPLPQDSMTSESAGTATEPSWPVAVQPSRSQVAVPVILYPPGFDFTGFIIYEPATGQWVDGAGYLAPQQPSVLPSAAAENGSPQPLDSSSGGGGDPGFYQVVPWGVTLYGLTNGQPISGLVPLQVEVGEPSGDLAVIVIRDYGLPVATYAPPFPQVFLFDTTQLTNGVHLISAYAETGIGFQDNPAMLQSDDGNNTNMVPVYNEISFPGWISTFGEATTNNTFGGLANSIAINFQSAHTTTWQLYATGNVSGNLGVVLSGSATANVGVSTAWSPPAGNDSTFSLGVKTPYTDPPAPPLYRISDLWVAPGGWAIANQQAWELVVDHEQLDTTTDQYVYLAKQLGLQVLPPPSEGHAYRISYETPSSPSEWATFFSAITDPVTRNLFYLGHGNADSIGDSTNGITAASIGAALGTVPLVTNRLHKFRCVIMDSCSSAAGGLPAAFGIIHQLNVRSSTYANGGIRPAVFAGWSCPAPVTLGNSTVLDDNWQYFQAFMNYWVLSQPLAQAFKSARNIHPIILNPNNLIVYGAGFMGVNTYNQ